MFLSTCAEQTFGMRSTVLELRFSGLCAAFGLLEQTFFYWPGSPLAAGWRVRAARSVPRSLGLQHSCTLCCLPAGCSTTPLVLPLSGSTCLTLSLPLLRFLCASGFYQLMPQYHVACMVLRCTVIPAVAIMSCDTRKMFSTNSSRICCHYL